MRTVLLRCIACILAVVIAFSGYQLWRINRNYAQEAAMHNYVLQFRPEIDFVSNTQEGLQYISIPPDDAANVDDTAPPQHGNQPQNSGQPQQINLPPALDSPSINQSIVDLRTAYPSAIGWLAIPNTLIDYPFVQAADNDFYLSMDLDHNRSQAGTVFMDYRNSSDFSDFNTIIFGHNMKNGSMFGTLQNFNSSDFFHSSNAGSLVLEREIYAVEFFAFAVINPNDPIIYDPSITEEAEKTAFLEYVQRNARHYRDIAVTPDDSIVTLSTCSYEFNNARMVLIGRLRRIR